MLDLGPNGGGFLRWVLDNIPALVAALSAAGAILMKYRRRNIWVWIFALSAFVFTFFSELTKNSDKNSDSDGKDSSVSSSEGRSSE